MQLLPFYARITASLATQFPRMAATVVDAVLRAVRGQSKSKDASQKMLAPRIRSARYLCELVKFRVIDAGALTLHSAPCALACNVSAAVGFGRPAPHQVCQSCVGRVIVSGCNAFRSST